MRVFVTGASGFIGSAVIPELKAAGHTVLGLTSSDKGFEKLNALGVEVLRGSLDDLDSLKKGASESDGVIHLAFKHDFANYAACCATDRAAITAIGSVLKGTNRPFVIASGTGLCPNGRLATEDDVYDGDSFGGANRGPSETLTHSFEGVRSAVVRLPPTTHGDGDQGFMPILINLARQKGESAYLGDNPHRWPTSHRLDAVKVFTLALEKANAGSTFHAVAEEGLPFKEIAEVIGERLGVPVVSKTPAEAEKHFGPLAFALAIDNPTSSAKTREQLGWTPVQKSLFDDLREGSYFSTK